MELLDLKLIISDIEKNNSFELNGYSLDFDIWDKQNKIVVFRYYLDEEEEIIGEISFYKNKDIFGFQPELWWVSEDEKEITSYIMYVVRTLNEKYKIAKETK